MLLTLFPDERPVYPEGKPEGERAEISLARGKKFVTALCRLHTADGVYTGRSAFSSDKARSELELDSLSQRAVKNAFYRAGLRSGVPRPVWGALTGVRPGKVFCSLMKERSPEAAMRRFMADYDVSPEKAALCRDTSLVTQSVIKKLGSKDICLYVGIPFCPTRCSYCSFVSQSVEKSMKLIPPFLDALMREIDAVAKAVNTLGFRVISIYMGGGTPTTLSASQLDRLLKKLDESFDLSHLREYTVEAGRPDTITEEKLRVLSSHGVDRVSVNPQTMQDSVLDAIGRKHTAQDIVSALSLVRKVGGFAVNMDLIAGLSSDTVGGFRDTLDKVIALSPENVTVHTLSLKKGSRLTLEGGLLPSAEEVSRMLGYAGEKLTAEGFMPYYLYRQKFMSGGFENVGWTKPGYTNIYNVCIMEELCPIIAVGGGGSTKLTAKNGGKSIRLFAPKYPQEYIQNIENTCRSKQEIVDYYKVE